jgi:hypothetical protein
MYEGFMLGIEGFTKELVQMRGMNGMNAKL